MPPGLSISLDPVLDAIAMTVFRNWVAWLMLITIQANIDWLPSHSTAVSQLLRSISTKNVSKHLHV